MNEMRERLLDIISQTSIELYRSEYDELVDALIDNGVIVPPVKVGQTVYEIDFRKQIRERRVSMITQKANGEFKARLSSRGCYSSDYTEDELERYVFLTREAAEEALKARENK